jgi:tetratricopeptide (TPR) repeat protein
MVFQRGSVIISLFIMGVSLFAQEPPGLSQADALQNYRNGRDAEYRNRRDEAEHYYNEAVRICVDEISRNPSNMDAYAIMAWTLQRQRKYAEVVSWGERALRVSAGDFRIIEVMAEAFFYLNRYDESLRNFQRYTNALPQGERASVAFFFIGEIFRLQGRYRHADIAYTTALRLEPNAALWWYRLGSVREAASEYAPAVEAYERAIKINPNYQEAKEGLARAQSPR